MFTDIIVLSIVGIIIVSLFLLWERYLERVMDDPSRTPSAWTPPPLMKLSLWTRAKGRMAVILAIAFLNACAFISWTFWVQVRPCSAARRNADADCSVQAVLPELPFAHTYTNYDPVPSNVRCWLFMYRFRRHVCWQIAIGRLCRYGSVKF